MKRYLPNLSVSIQIALALLVFAGRSDKASGQTLTVLYTFGGASDGAIPNGIVQGGDGDFYGTTSQGGTNSCQCGGVFKITASGTLTALHVFSGGTDGGVPYASLVQGSNGLFYGTSSIGGTNGDTGGTVFGVTSEGTLTTLHEFAGYPADGAGPNSLTQGRDGYFYGTTSEGGSSNLNGGTVLQMSPTGAVSILCSFNGGDLAFCRYSPDSTLVQGTDGSFYGTTSGGGLYCSGTVFKITSSGTLTTLYNFSGPDG